MVVVESLVSLSYILPSQAFFEIDKFDREKDFIIDFLIHEINRSSKNMSIIKKQNIKGYHVSEHSCDVSKTSNLDPNEAI